MHLKVHNRVAVIDLGSNTFHLLIVDLDSKRLKFVYRERSFVYLAQGGKEHINDDRFELGIRVIHDFVNKARNLGVQSIKGVGTSALRSADNAQLFIDRALQECDLEIEVVSGREEAALIYEGVSFELQTKIPMLIMDIGGGSLELIASENNQLSGLDSLPLGISHLRSLIHYSDPMTPEEHKEIKLSLKSIFLARFVMDQ